MAIEFSIQQAATQFAASSTMGQAATAMATGTLLGQAAVAVQDPMSMLADAAEEMTFGRDVTDECSLDERKEDDKVSSAMAERVKMYQDLMHESGAADQINQLKDSIRAKAGQENALNEARSRFPDPSEGWAALKEIYEDLAAEGASKEVLQGVADAIDTMEREAGPAIRAGMQGALAASGFSEMGSSDELRDLYRSTVCDFTSVNDVFAHIQEKYGDNFELALAFLYRSIGNDLACDQPSMETTHLQNVNANLGELRSVQSAHSLCSVMLNRWENVHGMTDSTLKPMELLGKVIDLRNERFLGARNIEQISILAKPSDIEHEVLFLQELLNTSRSFSPTLFDGAQGRMKVLDAVQEAVDIAITKEDAWLAAQAANEM